MDNSVIDVAIEVINDFRRNGYSYLRLPDSLHQEALSLATFLYELDVSDRLSALARAESGVLGYYPSELEAKELADAIGVNILVLYGIRARGYSSFDFIDETSENLGSSPILRNNLWLDKPPTFKEQALSLYKKFQTIAREFSCALAAALSLVHEDSGINLSQELHRDCLSLMRILNYRVDETARVSKEHTDYEFITLTVSTCEGLEVKSTATGTWEIVPNLNGHAILLPGDMLEVASGGYIRSSLHRARCGEKARRAVIFFQGLPLDFKIDYAKLKGMPPRTFGEHIFSMLLRGAAHLEPQSESLARDLNIALQSINPFRLEK